MCAGASARRANEHKPHECRGTNRSSLRQSTDDAFNIRYPQFAGDQLGQQGVSELRESFSALGNCRNALAKARGGFCEMRNKLTWRSGDFKSIDILAVQARNCSVSIHIS